MSFGNKRLGSPVIISDVAIGEQQTTGDPVSEAGFTVLSAYDKADSATMLECFKNIYWQKFRTMPNIPDRGIQRHLKALLEDYDHRLIVRAIYAAGRKSKHLFSVKFVRKMCEQLNGETNGTNSESRRSNTNF